MFNLKKDKIVILSVCLLVIFLIPSFVYAVELNFPSGGLVPCGKDKPCTVCDFFQMAQNIVYFIWIAMGTIAVVQIIIGGFMYMTAAGAQEQFEKAKKTITYGIIGLLIASVAWLAINTVITVFGAKSDYWEGGSSWWKIKCYKGTPSTPPSNDNTGPTPGPNGNYANNGKSCGEDITDEASKHIGENYGQYGCAKFVSSVVNPIAGTNLGNSASGNWGNPAGTTVSYENLQPGDILYFKDTYKSGISHTGIYVGSGMMIHQGSTGGENIKKVSINTGYWKEHYYGAKRYESNNCKG